MLVKAFSLLESLGAEPRAGMPLRDLARRAGVTRPTAHRILSALGGLGYVQNAGAGVYRIAVAWPRRDGVDPARLVAVARPVVEDLSRRTGETVNLGVLRGREVEYLLVAESRHPLRRVVTAGETDAFHSTALGRAIVSHLPEARREALVARVPRPDHVRKCLAAVLRDGYAIEQGETDVGVTCLGSPVFAANATVVAAVSISAPSARATARRRAQWLRLLRSATRAISATLKTGRD